MGWSCSAKAGIRLSAIQAWTYAKGGLNSQNAWRDPRTGERYMFEVGREQRDGAITAQVSKWVDDTHVVRVGSFRIEPDGKGFRGPAILKNIQAHELFIDGRSHREWDVFRQGEPNNDTLWKDVLHYAKSLEAGGINAHVSRTLGHVPYPNSAKVVCLNTGRTVAEWKAAMFQVWDTSAVA